MTVSSLVLVLQMHDVAFHGDPFLEQRSHGVAWGPSQDPFSGFVRSVLFYKNSTALFSCFFLFHSVDIHANGTTQCVCVCGGAYHNSRGWHQSVLVVTVVFTVLHSKQNKGQFHLKVLSLKKSLIKQGKLIAFQPLSTCLFNFSCDEMENMHKALLLIMIVSRKSTCM